MHPEIVISYLGRLPVLHLSPQARLTEHSGVVGVPGVLTRDAQEPDTQQQWNISVLSVAALALKPR